MVSTSSFTQFLRKGISVQSLLVIFLGTQASGCVNLHRSEQSGYASGRVQVGPAISVQDYYGQRKIYKIEMAREELGLGSTPSLSPLQHQQVQLRLRLKNAEAGLRSDAERKQYYRYKGDLKNDQERLIFLSLPTYAAKEQMAAMRGLNQTKEYPDHIADLIEKKDLAIGMDQRAVRQSWGDPDSQEVAGNPLYQNERWRYSRFVSSDTGYTRQNRILYFEAGRLAAWETQ